MCKTNKLWNGHSLCEREKQSREYFLKWQFVNSIGQTVFWKWHYLKKRIWCEIIKFEKGLLSFEISSFNVGGVKIWWNVISIWMSKVAKYKSQIIWWIKFYWIVPQIRRLEMEVDPSALPPRLPTGEIKPARFQFNKDLKTCKFIQINIQTNGNDIQVTIAF